MKIVWDEPKRQANIERHGLDFADLNAFEWEHATIIPARGVRQKAVGQFEGQIVVVIFAELGSEAYSVISFRPASKNERMLHAERP